MIYDPQVETPYRYCDGCRGFKPCKMVWKFMLCDDCDRDASAPPSQGQRHERVAKGKI
jgi:hypothetical protein